MWIFKGFHQLRHTDLKNAEANGSMTPTPHAADVLLCAFLALKSKTTGLRVSTLTPSKLAIPMRKFRSFQRTRPASLGNAVANGSMTPTLQAADAKSGAFLASRFNSSGLVPTSQSKLKPADCHLKQL
jgi:hypothetical protein